MCVHNRYNTYIHWHLVNIPFLRVPWIHHIHSRVVNWGVVDMEGQGFWSSGMSKPAIAHSPDCSLWSKKASIWSWSHWNTNEIWRAMENYGEKTCSGGIPSIQCFKIWYFHVISHYIAMFDYRRVWHVITRKHDKNKRCELHQKRWYFNVSSWGRPKSVLYFWVLEIMGWC